MLLNCMRPANDLSKHDPPIALLFARGNLPLTSPRRIFMRSSVQISSPHSAYSAHKAFATCSWSRISLLGACHMSFSWHHNQGKVHLCCNKCQGPEQTRPNHLGKRLPKTRPHGRCIAGVHLATWKPNKKCNKLSKLSQFFRSTSWCAWGTWKYMEVQADAAVLLHDHHSLQFVGNPMSFSASPTWSFWLLETPLVGSPWEAPDINASGIHPESRISNVLSNVWSLHPRHVKMHTPYHHHRHQIYGTFLLQDDISETTSLVVNPLIPLLHIFGFTGFS